MAEILSFPSDAKRSKETPEVKLEQLGSPVLPVDASARQAALDPQRSFLVEAPAGSGKTGLLMQRFLNLLGSPATTAPEEILAITFTRKATAELRDRIFQQLEAAVANAPLPEPDSPFEQKTRALAQNVLERDRQHGWNLLRSPRRLRVQTIDSLCIEIAGTLPLLSGSAVRMPVDDASELYREAARNTLRQLGGRDRQLHEALHTVLLHRDGNLADVENLLAEMLRTREQWAELVPLDRASLTDETLDQQVRLRLERTLEQIVCSGLTRALHTIPPHSLAELAALGNDYAGHPGYRDASNPFQLCGDHPGPPGAEAAHLDHWRALIGLVLTAAECTWRKGFNQNHIGLKLSDADKEKLKGIIAEIACEPLREALQAIRDLPPARYPDEQWVHAKALFRLLLHALAELKLLFADTGECDFTEFSLAARLALATHAEDFAASSGTGLRHLLVDEMQDTSSAQYDLLTALTRQWDGSSQTIFLVGDPKQSIYLFRQARVERFLRTVRDGRLGDVPLHFLQLTANFRSRPAVVEGVNDDFAHLFTPPGEPLSVDTADVPFVAATPARSSAPASGVHWHTRVLAPDTGKEVDSQPDRGVTNEVEPAANAAAREEAGKTRGFQPTGNAQAANGTSVRGLSLAAAAVPTASPQEQDAAAIRRIVERWRSTPLPPDRHATPTRAARPWRIAVLANARRHLAPIVAEFNRTGAGRTPIPYRAVKVEALEDRPEVLDAVALTRALHHPADRAAWFAVLRAPWCGLSTADLLTLAAEGDPARTKSTLPQLVTERAPLLSDVGAAHLHRAWPILQAALEVNATIALPEQAYRTWRSLGADALLSAVERTNVERYFALLRDVGSRSPFDLRGLKRRLHDLYAEPAEAHDAVDLMTIHSAKGLEWDVVLVPELGRQGQRERARLLNWLELESGSEATVLLAPIHGKGDEPSNLYRWLDKVHCRRLEAERKRVFYVACTRAREELHLFATARQGKKGLDAAAGSLLHACWPAAAVHFAALHEAELNDADGNEEAFLSAPSAGITLIQSQPGRLPAAQAQVEHEENVLALAAGADPAAQERPEPLAPAESNRFLPRLTRMPLRFDPQQSFREAAAARLPYPFAADLPPQEGPARPEGSAAVRALGNVVHRFLEQIARRLAGHTTAAALHDELPTWLDRLTASLRGEGLAPAEASREASRALTLLGNTLADPAGVWLLSPHTAAASERPLMTAKGLLRVDRTFQSGDAPLSTGSGTIWVVDFKTTEPGGRSPEDFLAHQRELYAPQLTRYAAALRADADTHTRQVRLGLYFPSVPRLTDWPAEEV